MTELPRLKPDPVPAIHPVPEYLAEGALAALYDDTKKVLQVPWVGVIAMAYAHYRRFYEVLWHGLRPLFASRALVEACADLRREVEGGVGELAPPPIRGRLESLGYAGREIAEIRAVIEVFSHGNFPYCVMATLARLALEGGELPAKADAEPFRGRLPEVSVPFVLIEAHHADAPTRAVYDEVKATLGLPFVNTDYRALARWPSYFALAWDDLKRVVGTPAHARLVAEAHARLVETVRALPNPGGLAAGDLREAAEPLDEVLQMSRLFHWLLPALVTNVAFLRAQLVDTGA
jgi:hypothetical protein